MCLLRLLQTLRGSVATRDGGSVSDRKDEADPKPTVASLVEPTLTEAAAPNAPAGPIGLGASPTTAGPALAGPSPQAPSTAAPDPSSSLEEEVAARAMAAAASLQASAETLKSSKWIDALRTFDRVAALVWGDIALQGDDAAEPDPDIREMLLDARDDLVEAALAAASGRKKSACSSLRGVMEGLFSALLYRQQAISLNLWAANISFHMVHSLFEERHEFFKYYQRLFEDTRFTNQYSGVDSKAVFKEAARLYDTLSAHVHKKKAAARDLKEVTVEDLLERVFQIFLTFLEREDDLPAGLTFPSPLTFPARKRQAAKRAQR